MNLKQLKYVQVLAEESSFSKAAKILGISQPSLSQYIRNIEKTLGVTLFDRLNEEIRLTDSGRIYVETGRQILNLERNMELKFADIAEHKHGSIIIGTNPYKSINVMPRVVHEMKNIFPGIILEIREATTYETINELEKGNIDFCVSVLSDNHHHLEYDVIRDEEIIIISADPLETMREEKNSSKYPMIDVHSIDQKDMIYLTDGQFMQKYLDNFLQEYNLTARRACTVKSVMAQMEMVKRKIGIAMVTSSVDLPENREALYFYSLNKDLPKRRLAIIWRKGKKLSDVEKTVINIIKDIYQKFDNDI